MDSRCWAALPSEMIKELFTHCALILLMDRSHDNLIHCLKEGQPCFQGRKVLGSQLKILQNENNIFKNPSESGVDKTYESCQLLYQQEEDDEGIDIL